ncbi:MAG TPA: substrate-binding domain-containing protein [Arachnia sp.]|nr:substrate-binding domain-containing protein [Arachnia sp.]HMT85086.1 substrate-binding domain-containing protein [Arachnia sp.]
MKRKLFAGAVAASLALALTACGSNTPSGGDTNTPDGGGDGITVALIGKGTDDHFALVRAGAMQAGADLGVTVNYNAPDTESEGDRQLNMLETAINSDAQAIGIAPTDGIQESAPGLIEAADVPFVIFDTPLPGSDAPITTIASDNPGIGARMAEELSTLLGGQGKVAMVTNGVVGTAAERRDGFTDWLEANAPGIEVVDIQNGEADPAKSRDKAQGILQAHPDLAGIAATGIYATIAIADEVATRGTDTKVVGVDAGPDVLTQIEEGMIEGVVAQNPYQIGYQTVETLVAAVKGETPAEKVIYTESLWVTKDGLQDPDIRTKLGLDG